LRNAQVRQWLDGVEPAWTLLTFDSLQALRQKPSADATAIRIANDLNADEIAGSAVARNTFILLQQAIDRGGLPLTATGNLSRAVVAEMRELIKWPGYDKTDAFRLHKVTNLTFCRCTSSVWSQRQPSSCPHGAASWCRSGNRCSAMRGRGAYRRSCSILRSGTWIPGISAAGYRFGEPHF
jgi:hypothetical protein